METLQISKASALTAYKEANEKGKKLLSNLFGEKVFIMDIRDVIKSYEDACQYLGIMPLTLDQFAFLPEKDRKYHYHDHRVVIIKRALNEGTEPDIDNDDQPKFYVWYKWLGSARGFVFGSSYYYYEHSIVGARHDFRKREVAEYFSEQFIDEVNACFTIQNP